MPVCCFWVQMQVLLCVFNEAVVYVGVCSLLSMAVSIWVDGTWFHRVKLPYLGHPRDTKRRYSLISHLEEWWCDEKQCWENDMGDEDYCADPRAKWRPTEGGWNPPEPIFWTRWPNEWVCPLEWYEVGPDGRRCAELPEVPEWVERSLSEIPPCFLFDCYGRRTREKLMKLTPAQRKNRL